MVNERRWLVIIFALYFILAVGYSLLMPIWEAPDEGAHYHLAWHIARKDQYASLQANYEAGQPRGFYYLGSLVIRGLNQINPDFASYYFPKEYKYNIRVPVRRYEWSDENYRFLLGVYVLRWLNILFGGLALWLNWKTFKQIAVSQSLLSLAALALAALTPQYLHIMSSVNNDALGTLAGALLFYLAIRVLRQPSIQLSLLSIGLAIVLPLTTKLTVLPVSVAVLVIVGWQWLTGRTQKRWLLLTGLLLLLAAGIFILFFPEVIRTAVNEIEWRLFTFRKNALTWKYIKQIISQIVWTYWGKVGWLAVGLPYWIVDLLTGLGFIGVTLHMRRLIKRRTDDPQLDLWLATGLIAAFTVLAVFRNGLTTLGAQGRLLFPAEGALALLMVAGWHEALPQRIQAYLPVVIVLFFLSCNLALWLTGVLPIYYQPFLD
jgi:hypothetical protein